MGRHGAFTKVLVDGLSATGGEIDIHYNGAISMAELVAYIEKTCRRVTNGDQELGLISASRVTSSSPDCRRRQRAQT